MRDKNIILSVTGSIAAYKTAMLTRLFIKEGCTVQVLMTSAAKEFVSPLTFSTLSRRRVLSDIIAEDEWNSHVDLGLWADAMIIAPATANTLSKCANGQSDSLIVATYLSARCPVFIAPAMDLDMWHHESTKENIEKLESHGDQLIPVGHGDLASGLTGDGRMAEPTDIIAFVKDYFDQRTPLKGKKAVVTAGPTHEAIDPVRFIGNKSTGTMGIAIADALTDLGAEVDLILGPTHRSPLSKCRVIRVESADEMYQATVSSFEKSDIAVLAAAVADFTPRHASESKIKKGDGPMQIDLQRTKDIAFELSKVKTADQFIVGFALETDSEFDNAVKKLERKKFDFIVLNSLNDQGAGFGPDTNKVKFIFPDNSFKDFELKSKREVAEDIVKQIVNQVK
ncbi:MAG: bifunctional phosphopantothenoylcysteine decarboxylase/phosphopantothenate--cysteine ligase CoaBC [Bacteroidetes bacterium]|nr:MAG: bifunctional phosphopantothenoylcysteine decarboxylase/phosphopantothenate--cysteine ligase CoaBC [Bacteroidota bacterium]